MRNRSVGLLRGQHPGRLVEDQDAGAAEQGLEDLDPLLHADRQLADRGVEIDLEPVFPLERGDLGPGLGGAGGQRDAALGAEQQVLQDRERLDQHEVLVDHADPGARSRPPGSRPEARGPPRPGSSPASAR